ncbi:cytochrome b/b6 domain-containing protein [Puniceibacterium sediminis]|uniref:Cytochrome b561 n=1 Tax=Puniceibacterium sediminis TaxID=1608407 RepID=A0A238W6N3_9RHOB|nr:cytochrome b/b6 domain-containing protein [Puniceibacterium sediminis]SNR42235.1 Cytochrome b561 [Puniceibacterium sediminis]
MPLTSTATRYGGVTKTLHWLTALGILCAIPLGIIANDAPYATGEQLAQKAWLFSMHKTLGVTIFFVAILRILWALNQPKPAPLHPERRLESWLAETVHWLLYGSLVLVPLTGWLHHAATSGFAPIWWPFGQSLPYVPKSEGLADVTAALHIVFERVLLISVVLHVVGALKHHFIDRDSTLRRMLPGTTEAGDPRHGHGFLVPLVSAVAFWTVALGVGAGLGVFKHDGNAAPVAALDQVESDWTVQEGSLSIAVMQLGSQVTGSFDNWTANITFDERADPGKVGNVTVTVAIGSLTLGSVTSQALGADFLAVDQFATAIFAAEIIKVAEGYEAQGTMTLRGTEVPVTLPFELTLDRNTARMQGRTTLDRRNYGIGESMKDDGQLGYTVDVIVDLTATREAES